MRLRTLRLIIRPFQLADALDYGFVRMGLHKVAAETVAANVPARLLLERLGFRQEGLLREHARLAGVATSTQVGRCPNGRCVNRRLTVS